MAYETILDHEVPPSSMSNLAGAAGNRTNELVQALKDGKIPGFELNDGDRVTVAMSRAAADWWRNNPTEHPEPAAPPKPADPRAPIVTDEEMEQVHFLCSDPNPIVRRFIVHDLMSREEIQKPCCVRANHRAKDYATSKRWAFSVDGVGMLTVATNGAIEHYEAEAQRAKITHEQQQEEARMQEAARLNAEARAQSKRNNNLRSAALFDQKALAFDSAGAKREADTARAKAKALRKEVTA